ncbi:MAG: hypothetical protein ABW328_17945 [Ilumatobacteraceae bacterium]
MSRRRRRSRTATGSLAASVLATLALTGCFTGERPHLAESAASTGDPAVDAVLTLLDTSRTATFSADYTVLTRFGGLESPASVVQAGDRRSITVGPIRFIFDGSSTATCQLETGACTETIDAGMISNTQLAPDFYGSSAAARLRRDAAARVGPTTARVETIGGQPATCVTLPIAETTTTYCALSDGVLARLDGADVVIELTAHSASADESKFARTSS